MRFNIRNYTIPKNYSGYYFNETKVPTLIVNFQDFTVTNQEAEEILAHDTLDSYLIKKGKNNTTYEQLYLLVPESSESELPSEDSAGPRAAGLRAVYELGACHVVDAVQGEIDTESFLMHFDEDPGDPPGRYIAVSGIERAFDATPGNVNPA